MQPGRSRGFVHRDLKPANVLVGADKLPGTDVNRLLVTDFGLIKILGENSVEVEDVHPVSSRYNQPLFTRHAGTYEYMAPEQWKGEPVGIYTDVYALGCILYEMISGKSAVEGATPEELQAAHCNGKLRPVPQDLLRPVSTFIEHSLTVDPKQRYQTWEDVTRALESLYEELGYGPVPRPAQSADENVEERRSKGSSNNAMGISYAHIGRAREAIEYFKKGAGIYHELGDRRQEGALLGNLGNAYAQLGKVEEALRYCEQDLEIAREAGDQRREAMAHGNLGDIHRGRGDIQGAIQYYEQRLQITRQIGDRRSEGNALGGLGQSYAALGNVERALDYYKDQLLITREIKDRRGEGNALCNFGNAYLAIGSLDDALAYYHQYLEITREIGDRTGEGVALGSLGNVQLSRGRLMSAMEFYQQRIEIAQQTGDRRGEGNALGNLGIVYTQQGEVDKALRCYQQRIEIAMEIDDRIGLCTTLFNMGHLYMQKGQSRDGMQAWVKSYLLAREMNLNQGLQKLAKLGPKMGLPEGLEIWENLAQRMQKQGMLPASKNTQDGVINGTEEPIDLSGSTATAAKEIDGIQSRGTFPNLYRGPTNNGVLPLDDSAWGYGTDISGATYRSNPIISSQIGLDGRTTRGTIEDYWEPYKDDDPDPYNGSGVGTAIP